VIEHARENRAEYGLWLTETGDVGEGPSMNVAFVTADGETLVTPPTSDVLAGCTMARAAELANEGKLASVGIARAEARRVPVEEARAAREAMLVGSVINCVPIVEWDGMKVGGNEQGAVENEPRKGTKEGEDAKEGDEGEGRQMRAATASGAAPPHAAGTPGPVALALHDLLVRDFETNEAELVDVPYELFEDERSDE
jgi:4-amino-4-deoxychorismate lyase